MSPDSTSRTLSPLVIVVSGIIFAVFCVAAVFSVSHLLHIWNPTVATAQRLVDKGRYDEALQRMNVVLAGGELTAQGKLLLGQIWMAKAYERLSADKWLSYGVDPDDYFSGEDVDSAVAWFKAAIAADPSRAEPHLFLGTLYFEKGWLGAAEGALLDALRNDPGLSVASINLAALYVAMGRYSEAERELLGVWQRETESADAARNLAVLYRHYLKQPDRAIEWSNRYLNMRTRNDPVRFQIRRDFEEMLKRYPEHAPAADNQSWRESEQSSPRSSLLPSY